MQNAVSSHKPAQAPLSDNTARFAQQYVSSTEAVLALTAGKLIDALEQLHNSGVVHSAFTPWSFDFTKDGVAFNDLSWAHKINGVAFAAETAEQYPNYVSVATEEYLAPEVWQGGKPTPASDLYSLGAILYYLATDGETLGCNRLADFRQNALTRLQQLSPNLSYRFVRMIADLLSVNPARRPDFKHVRWVISEVLAPVAA